MRNADFNAARVGVLLGCHRTLISDPFGRLQRTFPFGGDLLDTIASKMLKAITVTNQMMTSK